MALDTTTDTINTSRGNFHWLDYLVFGVSLGVSVLVGVVFAIKDKWHKQSTESYLMADRKMNWILVGLSFWATLVDAVFFIGLTTEVYYFGLTIVWVTLARYVGATFTVLVVIPKFFRLGFKITSAYEYFERRFNLPVRMVVGGVFIVTQMLSMAMTLYSPCLLLNAASGISIYWCLFMGTCVCMVYTAFGGMKAVIWVDGLQVLIMVAGMAVLAGRGVQQAGGIGRVWQIYADLGERDNWDDLDPTPWDRHSLWNLLFLQSVLYAGYFSTNQAVLQRYMTVPRMRQAQWSVFLGITLGIGFMLLIVFTGMAAFAHLGGNEPSLNTGGYRRDQILSYFLVHLLGDAPGVPGLVVASLFAAALSSMSSGQNAVTTVIFKDFVQPISQRLRRKEMLEKTSGLASRVLGVMTGVLVLSLSLAVPLFNDTLLSLSLSVGTFLHGPVLGLLLVGFFCFWVEAWGALVGVLAALVWAVTLYFGHMFLTEQPGLGMDFAPLFNNNFTDITRFSEPNITPTLFDVSYTWYVTMDVLVVLIVSSVVSLTIHCVRQKGRVSWSAIRPAREYVYRSDDFRAATQCCRRERKPEKVPPRPDVDPDKESCCDIAVYAELDLDGEVRAFDNPAFQNTDL